MHGLGARPLAVSRPKPRGRVHRRAPRERRLAVARDFVVAAHEPEQVALPLSASDGVEQGEVGKFRAFEQQGTDHDRFACVAGDDARPVQVPVAQQFGEAPALGGQREVLALKLVGLAVAEEIADRCARGGRAGCGRDTQLLGALLGCHLPDRQVDGVGKPERVGTR